MTCSYVSLSSYCLKLTAGRRSLNQLNEYVVQRRQDLLEGRDGLSHLQEGCQHLVRSVTFSDFNYHGMIFLFYKRIRRMVNHLRHFVKAYPEKACLVLLPGFPYRSVKYLLAFVDEDDMIANLF